MTVEISLNGIDYVLNDDLIFTFVGPNAGKMLWFYVLITIFTAMLMIAIAVLVSSYWNKITLQLQETRNIFTGDQPHVINKHPRYLIPELRSDLLPEGEGGRREDNDDSNSRVNIGRMIV